MTPIWPLLPVQTGSQSLLLKINHISTTARRKFTICALLYRSLILKKYWYKKVTPIWPLLPVQTGSQSLIFKKSYLNNHKRYIPNFCTIVQIVNCQKIFTKKWPNLTFTSCPNRKSKFNIYKNHISTTARGKFTIFAPLYRSLFVKKYLKKWPQFDLYFLSKPEVKV